MVDTARLLDEPSYFVEHYIGIEPFEYQKDFMDNNSNRKAFVSGRQVGKSRSVAWYALWKAVTYPGSEILITAKAQRQSMELFNQVKKEMRSSEASDEEWGVEKDTRTEIHFMNGSRIVCLPVGRDGSNIRGYGTDLVIVDEAAFVKDEIFQEVLSPMLAVGENEFILLSTPFGKKGFLYQKFDDDDWYTKQVPTSANPQVGDDFIEEQRENLTPTQFKQEILGQFVESSDSFFQREELMNCVTDDMVDSTSSIKFMGVDLAAQGTDASVYVCVDDDGNVFHIEEKSEAPLTDAMGRIRELDSIYNFTKIMIDSTGLGEGVVDQVKEELGRKVRGFKFTNEKKQSLYNNLKNTFQNGEIKFYYIPGKNDLSGNKMFNQCLDLTYSYTSSGKIRIEHPSGGHDDYSDALALAVWARSRKDIARSDKGSMKPFNLGSLR
jgi:Terminase-like family.